MLAAARFELASGMVTVTTRVASVSSRIQPQPPAISADKMHFQNLSSQPSIKNGKCCPGHSLSVSQPSKVSQKSHNSVYQCLGSLCDAQQALIFSWLRPRNQGTDNVSVIELSWTDRKNISSCHISFRYESSTLIFCKGPLYCFSSYIVYLMSVPNHPQ